MIRVIPIHWRSITRPLSLQGRLSILPPENVMEKWKADYKTMQENMIVGESLKWDELLNRIKQIEERFNGRRGKL